MFSVQIKILTVPTFFQVYESQEAETLAIHCLFTIQNTKAIKRNLTNVRKWRIFTQRVTIGQFLCGVVFRYTLTITALRRK